MKAYFFKTPPTAKRLVNGDNLVGRLVLPQAGNYIIQAKVAVASVDSRFNLQELFRAKLSCFQQSDEMLMAIFPTWGNYTSLYDPPRPAFAQKPSEDAGREAVVFLQLAVKLDSPNITDLSIFYPNSVSGLLFQSASILAYQVDELEIHDSFPLDETHRYRKSDIAEAFHSFSDLVKITR